MTGSEATILTNRATTGRPGTHHASVMDAASDSASDADRLSGDGATERIVLLGMMGAGKSTIGRLVAAQLRWNYLDNDEEVRAVTAREPGEIAANAGEATLHDAEAGAFLAALDRPRPSVIAAAAWVILDPACAEALRRQRCVIYLRAQPETLRRRVGTGAGRRRDATDITWLEARFRERDATYRALSTLTVDIDDLTPQQVADQVVAHAGIRGTGPR
jgi:shikimate kinase